MTAEADKENIASIRVLEKSGFELTGIIGKEGPIYSKVTHSGATTRWHGRGLSSGQYDVAGME